MLGTRARARAPEDHDPQPDETEPLAPISTIPPICERLTR